MAATSVLLMAGVAIMQARRLYWSELHGAAPPPLYARCCSPPPVCLTAVRENCWGRRQADSIRQNIDDNGNFHLSNWLGGLCTLASTWPCHNHSHIHLTCPSPTHPPAPPPRSHAPRRGAHDDGERRLVPSHAGPGCPRGTGAPVRAAPSVDAPPPGCGPLVRCKAS